MHHRCWVSPCVWGVEQGSVFVLSGSDWPSCPALNGIPCLLSREFHLASTGAHWGADDRTAPGLWTAARLPGRSPLHHFQSLHSDLYCLVSPVCAHGLQALRASVWPLRLRLYFKSVQVALCAGCWGAEEGACMHASESLSGKKIADLWLQGGAAWQHAASTGRVGS